MQKREQSSHRDATPAEIMHWNCLPQLLVTAPQQEDTIHSPSHLQSIVPIKLGKLLYLSEE